MVLLRQQLILQFPSSGQSAFFSAITFWCLIMGFRCDFFIMSIDDFLHIDHAIVGDFVVSWKMFCY